MKLFAWEEVYVSVRQFCYSYLSYPCSIYASN